MHEPPIQPRARVVLLGASNLTRAFPIVVETAKRFFGSPLEIMAALGHGRSYGLRSSILFGARALPGIVECGLWHALDGGTTQRNGNATDESHDKTKLPLDMLANQAQPVHALITDIGNDIMYGVPPQEIAAWVETCIERLQDHQARIAMTMLPIATIRSVRKWQFHIVKTLLFPTRRIQFEHAIEKAGELSELIEDLGQRRGVTLVQAQLQWYGFDPIHIRRSHWSAAWGEALGACIGGTGAACGSARPSFRDSIRLRTARPQRWWLFGWERRHAQPSVTLADSTTLCLY